MDYAELLRQFHEEQASTRANSAQLEAEQEQLEDRVTFLEARLDSVYADTLRELEGKACNVGVGRIIGSGAAATVSTGLIGDVQVAIKAYGSLTKDAAKAQYEAHIYSKLAPVQGRCVPKLVARGRLAPLDTTEENHFIACELVHGKPIQLPVTGALTSSVTAALDAIHRCGVLHCDIKADNIIVSSSGQVFFVDFERATEGVCPELCAAEAAQVHQLLSTSSPCPPLDVVEV